MKRNIRTQGMTHNNWNAMNRLIDISNTVQLDKIILVATTRRTKLENDWKK